MTTTELPGNYLTAKQARLSVQENQPETIFAAIADKARFGLHELCLPERSVPVTTRKLLADAGYTMSIGGIENEVLILRW